MNILVPQIIENIEFFLLFIFSGTVDKFSFGSFVNCIEALYVMASKLYLWKVVSLTIENSVTQLDSSVPA